MNELPRISAYENPALQQTGQKFGAKSVNIQGDGPGIGGGGHPSGGFSASSGGASSSPEGRAAANAIGESAKSAGIDAATKGAFVGAVTGDIGTGFNAAMGDMAASGPGIMGAGLNAAIGERAGFSRSARSMGRKAGLTASGLIGGPVGMATALLGQPVASFASEIGLDAMNSRDHEHAKDAFEDDRMKHALDIPGYLEGMNIGYGLGEAGTPNLTVDHMVNDLTAQASYGLNPSLSRAQRQGLTPQAHYGGAGAPGPGIGGSMQGPGGTAGFGNASNPSTVGRGAHSPGGGNSGGNGGSSGPGGPGGPAGSTGGNPGAPF
jgi:hypothetical protein